MTIAQKSYTGISLICFSNLTIGEVNDYLSLLTTLIIFVVTIRKIIISKPKKQQDDARMRQK